MPNVGMGELVLLMALALIIFGPKKLPEIGKSIGGALKEFNKAKADFMDAIHSESDRDDRPLPASTYSVNDASYTGSHELDSGTHTRLEYPEPMAAEHADALPFGSDFHAVEGDSQPSFRTASPEHAPAQLAAVSGDSTGHPSVSEGKA